MSLKMVMSTICTLVIFQSCTDKSLTEDNVLSSNYLAFKSRDTATLLIEIRGAHFSGAMRVTYKGTSMDSGSLKGDIKGDTLFGDFHFQRNGYGEWRRTPIAL